MKEIILKLLGSSPKTTVLGGLIAVIGALTPFLPAEYHKAATISLAVLYALYARVSKDSNGITAKEAKAVIKPEEKA